MSEHVLFYKNDDPIALKVAWVTFWLCVVVFYILLGMMIAYGN